MKDKQTTFQTNTEFTADLHTHSQASLDADKPITYILKRAREKRNSVVAVTDHNTLKGVNYFLDKRGYDRQSVMELIDNKKQIFIPGTEITCRISEIPNLKGNPTKIHLVAYGLDRDDTSFISQLLSIKHENDGKVDRGMLTQLQKRFNLELNDMDIIQYISHKRQQDKGFGTFGKNDVFDFAKYYKLHLTETDEELREIIHNFQPYERLNLEATDVINLVHASGGIVVLAHPYSNLKRTTRAKDVVSYLIANDIDGFELYHPFNTQACFDLIEQACKNSPHLIETGGSDFHSDNQHVEIYPHHIPYSDPELSKVKQFLDTMNEIKYKRFQGKLMIKDYAGIKGFNPIETLKKYKTMNNSINENAAFDSYEL